MSEPVFPERPEEPLPSDCCNSGCMPCILDVYKVLLLKWEEECNLIRCGKTPGVVDESKSLPLISSVKLSPFIIKNIIELSEDTSMFTFQAVIANKKQESPEITVYNEANRSLKFYPSQYFILQGSFKSENGQSFISRPYTPIFDTTLSANGSFEILVKFYPGGQMSQYFQSLKPGDITSWRGPYGNFKHQRNMFQHVLMLCAGTGIAPMYSIANLIVHDDLDDTRVKMLYCCRDEQNILLRRHLKNLQSFWNFNAVIYVSQEDKLNSRVHYGETIKTGYITTETIASELKEVRIEQAIVLICGKAEFCDEMKKNVKECGFQSEFIHVF